MLKILVDENIPAAELCFGALGEVILRPGRNLDPAEVRDADILVVRSVTRVNRDLLEGSRVRFVGTCTIGVDHVDLPYLRQQNIAFASAPGCNARAVAEYVMAALLELESIRDFQLAGKSLGIVGLGNVGSRLKSLAEAMNLNVLACDPPLQAAGHDGLVSPDEVWQADIVSLHVPYETGGAFPTQYLGDYQRLQSMVSDAVLINTSRGPVVDNRALSNVLNERFDLAAVLDVWEGEPLVNRELASQVDIATPHIAGYSHDGKVRGTHMIYQQLCQFLQQPAPLREEDLIPANLNLMLDFSDRHTDDPVTARDVLRKVYDISEDDLGLRASLQLEREQRGEGFDALRRHYRVRREFGTVQVRGGDYLATQLRGGEMARLRALGFAILP